MYQRLLNIDKKNSFFLFGARGTGKSTLLRQEFAPDIVIDLLDPKQESRFMARPEELLALGSTLKKGTRVLIDEVQKVPALLDVVHKLIEENHLVFALSGSSARKLKLKGANLLAGRAFLFHLFPLTARELKGDFDLQQVLTWGSLPKIFAFDSARERLLFLEAYVQTYLREEIRIEQLVRNIPAFTRFLEVAAQMNGKPLNYSKIGSDLGIDHSVVKTYYEILEDTLVGVSLPAFDKSVRSQVRKAKKFYLFDIGVQRELEGSLSENPRPESYEYGRLFEHFFILEVIRTAAYHKTREKFSFLLTKDNVEVDLVVDRPRKKPLFIEIKSTDFVTPSQVSKLAKIAADHAAIPLVVSQEKQTKEMDGVTCLSWHTYLNGFSDKL